MLTIARLSFGLAIFLTVAAIYTQVSSSFPMQRTVCMDGEQFTINVAWRGIKSDDRDGLTMRWERWWTAEGYACGTDSEEHTVGTDNPERAA